MTDDVDAKIKAHVSRHVAADEDRYLVRLRDYLAGQAIAALEGINPDLPDDSAGPEAWPNPEELVARRAQSAYLPADALLEARKK